MKILFVSLRPFFDVLERTLIRDALCLSDEHDLHFYCLRDSFLDQKLKEHFTAISYYSGPWSMSRGASRKRFDIKSFIESRKIDIVHCYDIAALFSLSQGLRKNIETSLILTIGKRLQNSYKGYLFKKMISRVDRVFLTTSLLEFSVSNRLGVKRHKISDLGLGEKYCCALWESTRPTFLKKYGIFEDLYTIGIYVPTEFDEVEDFAQLLPYVRHIQMRLGEQVRFILYSPLDWREGPLYKEVSDFFEEEQVSSMISFSHSTSFSEIVPHINLWVSAFHETNLMDYYIQALSLGTPVIWVRDYCSETILERYPRMGGTFKLGDARELGEHIEHFVRQGKPSDDDYIYAAHKLIEEDNVPRHKMLLEETYLKLQERRRRHLTRKRNKFI